MPDGSLRRIAIVGLGFTGQSIGLALRASLAGTEIVGHDRDADAAKDAQRRGAVSKTHWNLIGACDGAEVVFLAMPPADVIATLRLIAPEVADGVVLTDTAALKAPVVAWAESGLRPGLYYVGGHPLVRRALSPSAAALAEANYCLTPVAETAPGAVSLLAALATRMGAKPLFLDPDEHDGMMMALQQAPALAAAAALAVAMTGEARADLRTLRGAVPDEAVSLASRLALAGVDLTPANRTALRLELDRLLAVLGELRAAVDDQGPDRLVKTLELLDEAARFWENSAPVNQPAAAIEPAPGGSSWRRLFGLR